MEEHGTVSGLYQKNLEKLEKNKRWRNAASIVCILLGSFIVAVNMNTFVEQGKLVPGGFSGLAKLIQRVGRLPPGRKEVHHPFLRQPVYGIHPGG